MFWFNQISNYYENKCTVKIIIGTLKKKIVYLSNEYHIIYVYYVGIQIHQ